MSAIETVTLARLFLRNSQSRGAFIAPIHINKNTILMCAKKAKAQLVTRSKFVHFAFFNPCMM
jgi:hypothetical protein